jgi:hypothetical protein
MKYVTNQGAHYRTFLQIDSYISYESWDTSPDSAQAGATCIMYRAALFYGR